MEESNAKFLVQQCRDLLSMCESGKDALFVCFFVIPVIGPIVILRRVLRGWPLQWEWIIDPWTNRPMEGVDPVILRKYELYYPSPYWPITMTPEEEAEKQAEEKKQQSTVSEQDALVEEYVRKLAEATNYNEQPAVATSIRKLKSPWASKRDAWRAKRQVEEEGFDDGELDDEEEAENDEEELQPEVIYVERPTRNSDGMGIAIAAGLAGFTLGRLSARHHQERVTDKWGAIIRQERQDRIDMMKERRYKDQWLKDHVGRNDNGEWRRK